MPIFEATLKVRNGKKYETATFSSMIESSSSEINHHLSARQISTDDESGARILTKEKVDEEIMNYIPRLTRQL